MYLVLPSWVRYAVLVSFGGLIYLSLFSIWLFGDTFPKIGIVSTISTLCLLAVTAIFGGVGYYSPWRIVWRRFPSLNSFLFPDLNGVWKGEFQSNWPVLERVHRQAQTTGSINLDEIGDVDLEVRQIICHIEASLYRVRIYSRFPEGDAESFSTSAIIERQAESNAIVLRYFFYQGNVMSKDPAITSLTGAVEMTLNDVEPLVLKGNYWTQRRWREGLNTAGIVELRREHPRVRG